MAVLLNVLQRRASIMFSGSTGAVVASGEGLATSAPSYGLVKGVISVVEALPSALFDRHAAHRPCGLLDRRGAVGMLIGDVLGLPLMPWVLAEPVGKDAYKLKDKIAGEVSRTKKKAQRKRADAEAAAAAVLHTRVTTLPLPSASEIKAAWRRIAKAAPPNPHRHRHRQHHRHRQRQSRRHAPVPRLQLPHRCNGYTACRAQQPGAPTMRICRRIRSRCRPTHPLSPELTSVRDGCTRVRLQKPSSRASQCCH